MKERKRKPIGVGTLEGEKKKRKKREEKREKEKEKKKKEKGKNWAPQGPFLEFFRPRRAAPPAAVCAWQFARVSARARVLTDLARSSAWHSL